MHRSAREKILIIISFPSHVWTVQNTTVSFHETRSATARPPYFMVNCEKGEIKNTVKLLIEAGSRIQAGGWTQMFQYNPGLQYKPGLR